MIETPDTTAAFRALRAALLRRRVQSVEPRLRVEIAAIAALIGGFLFWQLRMRFAGVAHARGAAAVTAELSWLLAALAVLGGIAAAVRHLRILRSGGVGLAWLALPVASGALRRQFTWEARLASWWVTVPAAAALAAATGPAPATLAVTLAPAFVAALVAAAHAGCAVSGLAAAPGARGLARRLSYAAAPERARGAGRVAWRRASAASALWHKDLLLLARSSRLRERLLPAAAFAALSAAAWFVPDLGRGAHALAFALGLIAAGAVGDWILALSGLDPFAVLRSLPVGWPAVWRARMRWAALAAAALLAVHAIAARPLAASPRAFFLVWLGLASLALTTLAVHYAQTVFPRAEQARRLYELSLGLAIVGSLLIPLLGWIVLLTAVIHSARRLPRWAALEDRP
jgi:hypothetical protein